jgi:hypothetical protein
MPPREALPESAIPRRKATPGRIVLTVLLGAVLVPAVAFLITGTLLTIGIVVLPLLLVAAVLYLAWSVRRGADRDTGLDANPPATGAERLGPRGGTYG